MVNAIEEGYSAEKGLQGAVAPITTINHAHSEHRPPTYIFGAKQTNLAPHFFPLRQFGFFFCSLKKYMRFVAQWWTINARRWYWFLELQGEGGGKEDFFLFLSYIPPKKGQYLFSSIRHGVHSSPSYGYFDRYAWLWLGWGFAIAQGG